MHDIVPFVCFVAPFGVIKSIIEVIRSLLTRFGYGNQAYSCIASGSCCGTSSCGQNGNCFQGSRGFEDGGSRSSYGGSGSGCHRIEEEGRQSVMKAIRNPYTYSWAWPPIGCAEEGY